MTIRNIYIYRAFLFHIDVLLNCEDTHNSICIMNPSESHRYNAHGQGQLPHLVFPISFTHAALGSSPAFESYICMPVGIGLFQIKLLRKYLTMIYYPWLFISLLHFYHLSPLNFLSFVFNSSHHSVRNNSS